VISDLRRGAEHAANLVDAYGIQAKFTHN